jgi:hypothetical protein
MAANPHPLTLRFKNWSLGKKSPSDSIVGGHSSASLISLLLKSAILIPICKAKYDDLMSLLSYVSPVHHTLTHDQDSNQEYER